MKNREVGWEPILDVISSEHFDCDYGGNFAQNLQINRTVIEKFLSIASLDGRVLITDSKLRRPQATPDINPDGSVTSKGVLRWGEKPQVDNPKQNLYFQVNPDPNGWTIAVNGGEILEDIMKRQNKSAREATNKFAAKANYLLRVGLKEALLKEKFTYAKDPFVTGRMVSTAMLIYFYGRDIFSQNWDSLGTDSLYHMSLSLLTAFNYINGPEAEKRLENQFQNHLMGKLFYGARRNAKTVIEIIDTPLQLDRALLAYGYLDYQMFKRNPLIRASR
jgi:hypothetical protein